MPIGSLNSTIYAKCVIYRLFAEGLTEQGHTILFSFQTRPQAVHLHNLTQKSNVLLINGK